MDRNPSRRHVFCFSLVLWTTVCLAAPPVTRAGTGPYLGQKPPGDAPEIFAPGIVSTGLTNRDMAMTPDGRELYFSIVLGNYAQTAIATTRQKPDGTWMPVEVAAFSGIPGVHDLEPCISPDGKRLLFLSNRSNPDGSEAGDNQDIWVMDRRGDTWQGPRNLGPPVNSEDDEFFPSVTRSGSIYFTRAKKGVQLNQIYRCRFVDGALAAAELLPPEVNAGRTQFNAFIDPDERFLILSIIGLPDAIGRSDYYVCFRGPDDTWSKPVNLGPTVNRAGGMGYAPYISPDGAYFFFMSTAFADPPDGSKKRLALQDYLDLHATPYNGNANICWVRAEFIEKLATR